MAHKDKEVRRQYLKAYRKRNKDYWIKWRNDHPDYMREWNGRNKDYAKKWHIAHPNYMREWNDRNRIRKRRTTTKKKQAPKRVLHKGEDKILNDKLLSMRSRMKLKGLKCVDFPTLKAWYSSINTTQCHYCGIEQHRLATSSDVKKRKMTFDRKESSKGYTIDNMVVACFRCNNKKGHFFTYEEWMDIAERTIKPKLEEYHELK